VDHRRRLGADGEALVAAWYEANGYRVVARNWRCRDGELDIVAVRGRTLVVCEVKTRTSARFGVPAEAVTVVKQRRLRRLASTYLREAATFRPDTVRFDVAAVLGGRLELIEAAF
jgi:putative endonuclease